MPNGYRRGGRYTTRSGAAAYRRGAKIRTPRGLIPVAGGLVALSALTGGSLVGSPVLIALTGTALLGLLVWRNRRRLAPVGRRMMRWADKRAGTHGQRATLVTHTKAPKRVRTPRPERHADRNDISRARTGGFETRHQAGHTKALLAPVVMRVEGTNYLIEEPVSVDLAVGRAWDGERGEWGASQTVGIHGGRIITASGEQTHAPVTPR